MAPLDVPHHQAKKSASGTLTRSAVESAFERGFVPRKAGRSRCSTPKAGPLFAPRASGLSAGAAMARDAWVTAPPPWCGQPRRCRTRSRPPRWRGRSSDSGTGAWRRCRRGPCPRRSGRAGPGGARLLDVDLQELTADGARALVEEHVLELPGSRCPRRTRSAYTRTNTWNAAGFFCRSSTLAEVTVTSSDSIAVSSTTMFAPFLMAVV